MISINGNMFENFQNTKRLDKFFSIQTDTKDFGYIKMYNDILIKRESDKSTLSFIDNYGSGKTVFQKSFTKVVDNKDIPMTIYGYTVNETYNLLIVILDSELHLYKINKNSLEFLYKMIIPSDSIKTSEIINGSQKNGSSVVNQINNDVYIDIFPKGTHSGNKFHIAYMFYYYNKIFCFSIPTDTLKIDDFQVINAKSFISGNAPIRFECLLNETTNEYKFMYYYVYELEYDKGQVHFHYYDLDGNPITRSSNILIESELYKKSQGEENYSLRNLITVNDISNIYSYYEDKKIYVLVSLFSGDFYRFLYNEKLNEFDLDSCTKLFSVKGTIEKVVITNKYILAMHDLNEIICYNKSTDSVEVVKLINTPIDLISNNLFFTTIEDENIIGYYKLENVPDLKFNYWWVENYNVDDKDTYILNNHVTLKHKYNIVDRNEYDVKLDYRKVCSVEKTFPETMQSRNMYMFLDKDNILLEPSFKLYSDKLYYTITNKKLDYEITNHNTKVKSEKELLPKVFIKDIYNLNNRIYFRMKYLFKDNYIMVIEVDDKKIIINKSTKRFYTETIDDKKYFFVKDDRFLIDRRDTERSNKFIDSMKIEYQRKYDEVEFMHNQWYWFQIDDIPFRNNYLVEFKLYYKDKNSEDYKLVDSYTNSYSARNTNIDEILYETHDGDIKMIENLYLQEEGSKDKYLTEMCDPIFETKLDNSSIKCNKSAYIGNYINTERNIGQLDLTTEYPFAFKYASLLSNIYINGKKVFREYYKQFDNLQGVLYSYLPIRLLKEYLSKEDYEKTKSTGIVSNNNEIVIDGNRRKLVESEKVLLKHTVDNSLQDETSILCSTGLYLSANISKNIRSNHLRVYIKKKAWNYFRRINPDRYRLTIDYDYNMINLIVYGSNYCTEGNEIFIVTNGVMNGANFYKDLTNTPYDIESIPLISTDNDSNLYTNIVNKPEDLEIIIDGYTMYPYIDYDIFNFSDESIPSLIVFNNIIPKTSKIEVNYLNENQNYVRYFKYPAEGTDNIISFNDDSLLLIPDSFIVFIDNLKIDNSDIEILNTKSFKINNHKDIKNIMVRFSYDDHTHLKEIFDIYKYEHIDFNDEYYHSFYKDKPDNLLSNTPSKSVRKLSILNNQFSNQMNYFNCNDPESTKVFDILLDSSEISSPYINDDIIIDCNPINKD